VLILREVGGELLRSAAQWDQDRQVQMMNLPQLYLGGRLPG
jgi:hypothetical protein